MSCTLGSSSLVACFVTVPTRALGDRLAESLVQRRLAACVNILPGVTSVYAWKGQVTKDEELLLMIKSRSSLVPEIVALVKEQHTYEVPEVIALPLLSDRGNPKYLEWLLDSTKAAESDSGGSSTN